MSELNHNEKSQMNDLSMSIDKVIDELDTINPENAGVADIDRIIAMLDELELQCKQVRDA